MKTFTTNFLLAAAAMVVAAGSASAQGLLAEIPFSFNAGGKLMAPGTYRVMTRSDSNSPVIRLFNQDNQKSHAILLVNRGDAAKAWIEAGTPKLAFDCIDGRCTLAQVWDARDRTALQLRDRRRNREIAGLTVVTVKATKAE